MEQKIVELEEKFAHLDHAVEELNAVIFRQTQKISELEEMIKHLSLQIRQANDQQEDVNNVVSDERPPHY